MQIGHDGETEDDPARLLTVNICNVATVVRIPHHASLRMGQRRVSEDDLTGCLKFPSVRGLPTQPGRKRIGRDDPHRHMRIEVVYEEASDGSITIVTAFWGK